MAYDFPNSPSAGQEFTPSGGPTYVWQSPRWVVKATPSGATIAGTAPSSPATGQIWWNSSTKVLSVWTGSAWEKVDAVWA